MTTEEFLSGYQEAKSTILLIEAERESIREMMTRITPAYGGVAVSHSGGGNQIPATIARLEEYDAEHEGEIRRCIEQMREVRDAIFAVKHPGAKGILTQVYILGKTHQQVADEMERTLRWEHKAFRRAKECIVVPKSSQKFPKVPKNSN